MLRTPQISAIKASLSSCHQLTPSSQTDSQSSKRIDDYTREKQDLLTKIAKQKERNHQLKKEIEHDYETYKCEVEKANGEVMRLKSKY